MHTIYIYSTCLYHHTCRIPEVSWSWCVNRRCTNVENQTVKWGYIQGTVKHWVTRLALSHYFIVLVLANPRSWQTEPPEEAFGHPFTSCEKLWLMTSNVSGAAPLYMYICLKTPVCPDDNILAYPVMLEVPSCIIGRYGVLVGKWILIAPA